MKIIFPLAFFGLLFFALLVAGCTSTTPQPQPLAGEITTAVPLPAQPASTSAPSCCDTSYGATPVPFPGAHALNTYVAFGRGEMTGKASVIRFVVKPNYTWAAPSFNSPREQAESTGPFDIQHGYNTEKPKVGNIFLFIWFRVTGTGTKAVYAPSPQNIVVSIDGKLYNYSSVHSSDVTIAGVVGTQYDYQIGKGGVVGYVEPGEGNSAEGYLIYEIPQPFSPEKTFVVSNLDYQTQVEWKLE